VGRAWAENDGRSPTTAFIPSNSVPEGRLNVAQDVSPGLDLKNDPVPQGRLKMGRDTIRENLQPSLWDSIMFHFEPRTIVLG
jgi:hypothetical protein